MEPASPIKAINNFLGGAAEKLSNINASLGSFSDKINSSLGLKSPRVVIERGINSLGNALPSFSSTQIKNIQNLESVITKMDPNATLKLINILFESLSVECKEDMSQNCKHVNLQIF